jgi:hypothetical protein
VSCICGRNDKFPRVTVFHEMFCDTERDERAPAQRDEGRERNDQPISVLQGLRLGNEPGGFDDGTGPIHELDSEPVQTLAGLQGDISSIYNAPAMRLVRINNQDQSTPGQISLNASRSRSSGVSLE